jgi:2'-5' RNA ligase
VDRSAQLIDVNRSALTLIASIASIAALVLLISGCESTLVKTDVSHAHRAKIYEMDERAFSLKDQSFVGHRDYVSIGIPYTPFPALLKAVEHDFDVKLKTRGESHVTVMTPPEYDKLKSKLSMTEIDQLAWELKIATAEIKPICIGRGDAKLLDSQESVFYIVVEAPALLVFREKIAELYHQKGGSVNDFVAKHFYPHITIGFSKVDLHEQNGVIKDAKSCQGRLEIIRAVQ